MLITKICEVGNHPFTLTEEDLAAYKKFGVEQPLPICFPHQHQQRLAFRNDRFLHRRKCDLTGEEIISMYPAEAPYKVYKRDAWFSDAWDPLSYGRPFDFSKTFFEQYAELQSEVPRMALVNVGSTNSDFCNSCVFNKNCYLIFGGDRNEDCMFGSLPMYCKNCVDCDWTRQCQLCYFCAYAENCYQCQFAFYSKNCSDCAFIENCIGCNDCILPSNLRNKSYCIENKQYSKEEYLKKKAELVTGSYENQQALWKRFQKMRSQRVVLFAHILNGENVSGELIFHSKNCLNCYECIGSEDCRDCWTIFESKDCFNSDYIGKTSVLNYNNLSTDNAYNGFCCYFLVDTSDTEYCELMMSSKHCFGSIGIRHEEFCILNKKYSPEEYKTLREKIIVHMKRTGEFGRYFPKKLSTFPYNESTASYFFPLKKEEALAAGFKWRDEKTEAQKQTNDETLACEVTGKNFRIIPQELEFYVSQKIPIPRRHPDQRYYDRLALRNPFTLFDRACGKCSTPIKTTYAPNRPETVY